jgi:hypothetical protein
VGAWFVWFVARALAATVHRQMLDACAACGRPLAGALAFSPLAGGACHAACAPRGESAALGRGALAALERLYTARLAEFAREPLAPAAVRQVRAVHDLFVPFVLERRPAGLAWVGARRRAPVTRR